MAERASWNDNEVDLLRKLVDNSAVIAAGFEGIDASITLADFVGKTATFENGVLTGYS